MSPHKQIVAQMYYLEKDFSLQIEYIIPNRLLIVDYEKIYHGPNSFLTEVKNKLHKLGHNIAIEQIEKSLRISSIKNENDDVLQLQEYINQYSWREVITDEVCRNATNIFPLYRLF